MKLAVYSTRQYERKYLEHVNESYGIDIEFFDFLLSERTAKNAVNCEAVCIFVNDDASRAVLEELAALGVKYVALRCAGFNNVDLDAARELGLAVVRVPAYSPEAVAEHAVGLMMTLNRHIHRAWLRTRDANFSLEGLTGFNMHGRTAGIIGTGKIGLATLRILNGFGMRLLAYDPYPNPQVLAPGAEYVDLATLFNQSDVISLHCPLTPENQHLLNASAFAQMKDGVMIINTSRGALIDSKAAIEALKMQKIGSLGMDVYENERDLFFEDKSNDVIQDDVFRRLSACHNVLFTGHQAFLTSDALINIAQVTLENLACLARGDSCSNELTRNQQ
ncbi:2-hydroxyacid dehydrogenase [Izhakiella australiensis]|uniref:2-hydroxyacid dehydrogenase n=1 Tax=Izhakiella australiensis TaxID=1926881 RepID=A0A1S8YRB3_9GAMM|nr:2-hydroxyacid dehydrogenase [Izhakiella australiensis]OON41163.1 2-hydroxyacid dehydrogenase [Izhakiella australiensis]